jgi:hypothetical protein
MSIPTFNKNIINPQTRYNRGTDNKFVSGVTTPVEVGLYTIDSAILKYLQNTIKPVITQQKKQIQVTVIYGNPERWKSAQQDGNLRDKNGMILLPIMMIRRLNIKENKINSPVNKYQSYTFQTKWNSRNIYDRFAAINKITPSQVYSTTIVPDFYDIAYEAMIWTEYMEQMNSIVENITFESNEYWGDANNYKFIVKIGQVDQTTDLPSNTERLVRSKFSIDVKGYILPKSAVNAAGKRGMTSTLQYSPKKTVFTEELVVSSTEIR